MPKDTKPSHFMRFQVLTAASMKFRVALMMEAVCTSETSVNFKVTTPLSIPENSKLHTPVSLEPY
jgi:hypothetical protein